MKVLVPVKRVVDFNVKVRVKGDGSGVETVQRQDVDESVSTKSPSREALRLKEAGKANRGFVVVSIGPAGRRPENHFAPGSPMGADRGILVKAEGNCRTAGGSENSSKPSPTKRSPAWLFSARQAIDDDSNQTGQMLAALLGWSQADLLPPSSRLDGSGFQGDAPKSMAGLADRQAGRGRRSSPPICG